MLFQPALVSLMNYSDSGVRGMTDSIENVLDRI